MKNTLYPSLEEALELHRLLIQNFGGSSGVRDLGLLESALARPQSGYYKTLIHQAGALFHSLINNHCFVDGNKRMAFALTATFLRMNGYTLSVDPAVAEKFIVNQIIGKKVDAVAIGNWLGKHLT